MTLTQLIYTAYGNGGFNTAMRVTGGPDWVSKTTFYIEGVAAGTTAPGQLRLMLQTLLEDRFALKLSRETPTVDMLTLVLDRADGRLGPKVRKWDGTCPAAMPALVFPAARRPLQRDGDNSSFLRHRTRTIPNWPTAPPDIAWAGSQPMA